MRELTAAEQEALAAEGLHSPEMTGEPILASSDEQARMLEEALDVPAAADKMGIAASRVRQLLSRHRLYGIKQDRDWRLPRWQFNEHGRGTVSGIEEVIEAMPLDLHPLSTQGFMTTPQPELRLRGDAVSPLEWLGSGGDPATIADLATEL